MVNRSEPAVDPFLENHGYEPKRTTLITIEGFGAVSNARPKTVTTQA
jgi:hypothetical protein